MDSTQDNDLNLLEQAEVVLGGPTATIKHLEVELGRDVKSNYFYRWRSGGQRTPLDVVCELQAVVLKKKYPKQAGDILALIKEPTKK
ncbi:hypothetical protein EOL70_13360 [Leucothrix sargassi]|nr:hypothetical protein EOL70_13360 [Leucothrix sargassi]